MRLRTRLVAINALVLLVVGGPLAWSLPRVTEGAVLRYTAAMMARQVEMMARSGNVPGRLSLPPGPGAAGTGNAGEPGEAAGEAAGEPEGVPGNLMVVDGDNQVVFPVSLRRTALGRNTPGGLGRLAERARQSGRGQGLALREAGMVAGAAPLPGRLGRPGFVLILLQPVADLQPALARLQRQVLFWTLVGLVLATALGAAMAGAVARRLRHLRTAAAAIAAGDLSQRAPETGQDEVADLARSFNHMAGRLQQTVTGLYASEQLRRDLVAALAHELRTPVTAVQGFAEALRDGVVKDPGQRQRYLGIIAAECQRLARLVADLFDFATLVAGKQELRRQPLAIVPWLQDHAATVRARVEAAGLCLDLQTPADADDPVVLADADRLAQVIANLVDNALRHGPPGSTVALALGRPSPDSVRISVSDQGPGVPPGEQEQIWERFHQGSSGRPAPGPAPAAPGAAPGGAGLGLAIVKAIVTAHGGHVGVTNVAGAGACFWFTLPVGAQ